MTMRGVLAEANLKLKATLDKLQNFLNWVDTDHWELVRGIDQKVDAEVDAALRSGKRDIALGLLGAVRQIADEAIAQLEEPTEARAEEPVEEPAAAPAEVERELIDEEKDRRRVKVNRLLDQGVEPSEVVRRLRDVPGVTPKYVSVLNANRTRWRKTAAAPPKAADSTAPVVVAEEEKAPRRSWRVSDAFDREPSVQERAFALEVMASEGKPDLASCYNKAAAAIGKLPLRMNLASAHANRAIGNLKRLFRGNPEATLGLLPEELRDEVKTADDLERLLREGRPSPKAAKVPAWHHLNGDHAKVLRAALLTEPVIGDRYEISRRCGGVPTAGAIEPLLKLSVPSLLAILQVTNVSQLNPVERELRAEIVERFGGGPLAEIKARLREARIKVIDKKDTGGNGNK